MPDIFVSPKHHKKPTVHPAVPRKTSMVAQAFSSFLLHPTGMRFETQQTDETIILLLRKHFITNLPWIIIGSILLFLPPFAFPLLLGQDVLQLNIPQTFVFVLLLTWYLLTFTYIFVNFLLWYFTVNIVTDERIVDIDFVNILYKEFSATTLGKVEDVTSKRGGFFGLLFDYGDVFIQTAAATDVFEFISVPHPEDVVRIVNDRMEEQRNKPASVPIASGLRRGEGVHH